MSLLWVFRLLVESNRKSIQILSILDMEHLLLLLTPHSKLIYSLVCVWRLPRVGNGVSWSTLDWNVDIIQFINSTAPSLFFYEQFYIYIYEAYYCWCSLVNYYTCTQTLFNFKIEFKSLSLSIVVVVVVVSFLKTKIVVLL